MFSQLNSVNFVELVAVPYFLSINFLYLIILIAAILSIRRYKRSMVLIESVKDGAIFICPSISILAPAYNEEKSVVDSVKSLLMLNYPKYEIILINDGSKDSTLDRLKEAFSLLPFILEPDVHLSKTNVREVYRSKMHPNLIVIDKENGGKADALNVGIGYAQYEVFCAVDSDSILEPESLLRISLPFIEDPEKTVAAGGTIRVVNGCEVEYSQVSKIALPKKFVPLMQVMEYTRAFLCGRVGWNVFNATLVISGAFGLFRKSTVIKVNGYLHGSMGEDMELVVRLHRVLRNEGVPYKILFIPEPVCWTEVPESMRVLKKQRDRWHRGLADTIVKNISILGNPKFGTIGFFAFPYMIFVELLGPYVEIASYIGLFIQIFMGWSDPVHIALFFSVSVGYGVVMSMASVVIEELYYSKYSKKREVLMLLGMAVLENFGYRQINTLWRAGALINYFKGVNSWGAMERQGISSKILPKR